MEREGAQGPESVVQRTDGPRTDRPHGTVRGPSSCSSNEVALASCRRRGRAAAFFALPYVPWNFLLNSSTRPAASTNLTDPVK